ncbi:MAG: antifreeze protein [Paracoccaceae bacterium]
MNRHAWELWSTGFALWRLGAEAQTVIGLRMLGMAGLWPVTASENARMISEKGPAFVAAWGKATQAALAGKRPDQIALAAARPLRRRTGANAKRLAGRALR